MGVTRLQAEEQDGSPGTPRSEGSAQSSLELQREQELADTLTLDLWLQNGDRICLLFKPLVARRDRRPGRCVLREGLSRQRAHVEQRFSEGGLFAWQARAAAGMLGER